MGGERLRIYGWTIISWSNVPLEDSVWAQTDWGDFDVRSVLHDPREHSRPYARTNIGVTR